MQTTPTELIVGVNVPAVPGMSLDEVSTPALIVELDPLEENIRQMRRFIQQRNIRHRAHAKTHKSADIARLQMTMGGACGVCCQKVSEAHALINQGIDNVLISNQVVAPEKIDLLAKLSKRARVQVCVDDPSNVAALSGAALREQSVIECLVEINNGAGRCGVEPGPAAVSLARLITEAPGLKFSGIQAYDGSAQHITNFEGRRERVAAAISMAKLTVDLLNEAGFDCEIIGGAGTGSYPFESNSGLYNELQCGSYIFMDADYQRVHDSTGQPLGEFRNSLFIWTSIMSVAVPGIAVCDAGLKAHSVDSGLPVVFGRSDVEFLKCSDEHGVIRDPDGVLKLNEKLKLVPGHCDPTCNLYDWYVGIRGNQVECLWPVTARGMLF
ncbi:MAG: DSD1 family PLP-dependent enzyme [Burkholderiaceae bacterium]